MVSEAPTSSEIPWGSVLGDPGKEHRPGTYNNESWFCRIPFLFIGVFPFSRGSHSISPLPQAALLACFRGVLLPACLFL